MICYIISGLFCYRHFSYEKDVGLLGDMHCSTWIPTTVLFGKLLVNITAILFYSHLSSGTSCFVFFCVFTTEQARAVENSADPMGAAKHMI